MKVIIISSLGNRRLNACLSSMLSTTLNNNFDIEIIRERKFREKTLNFALENKQEDILIVGDDIVFTKGWYESLKKNFYKADVIGFSTVYPKSRVIQDRGYDLSAIDGEVKLKAKDRGLEIDFVDNYEFRKCDMVCGCLFLIKKEVLQKIKHFSPDGMNRWGEFIYMIQAKKEGFKVGVIDHYVFHGGISTKNNPSLTFSSQSYMLEKIIWARIVKKYVSNIKIKKSANHNISQSLEKLLKSSKKILLFGAGTVSELIIKKHGHKKFTLTSGLKEEYGQQFQKLEIKNFSKIDASQFDLIIITVLMKGKEIYEKHINKKLNNKKTKVIEMIEGENYVYDYGILQKD